MKKMASAIWLERMSLDTPDSSKCRAGKGLVHLKCWCLSTGASWASLPSTPLHVNVCECVNIREGVREEGARALSVPPPTWFRDPCLCWFSTFRSLHKGS